MFPNCWQICAEIRICLCRHLAIVIIKMMAYCLIITNKKLLIAGFLRSEREEKERGKNAEETMELVVKLFNEKLGVKVEKQDIDVVHRIGRMEEGRYRTIVVRFVRRVVRAKVIEKRRQLKNSGVVIADDLSPNNAWKYRQLKETFGAKNVWSRDGKLFAVSTQGEKIAITTNNFQHVINKAAEDTQARQTGQHGSTVSQGFWGYGRGRGRFNRNDVSF